jgi:hypothetical protein
LCVAAPGLGQSYRKYSAHYKGESLKIKSKGALHHESISVVTELDWIAQIDQQVGLVQKILCDLDDKVHQNACHLLEGTICHLLEHCGDSGRFQGCEFSFDLRALLPTLKTFLNSHRLVLVPVVLTVLIMFLLAIVPEIL